MDDDALCRCGALLPLPDLTGESTCPSCGRVTERAIPGSRPSGDATKAAHPLEDRPAEGDRARAGSERPDPGTRSTRSRTPTSISKGCGISAIVYLVFAVLAVVLGVVIAFVDDRDETSDGDATEAPQVMAGSVVMGATAEPGGPLEVLALVRDRRATETRVVRLREEEGSLEPRWFSTPLPGDVYNARIVGDDERVYVVHHDRVTALSARSGVERWSARLRDDVTQRCGDCVAVVGGHLVVRTVDAHLTGFGPDSDEQLWARRLVSQAARPSVVGGDLLLVDDAEGGEPGRRTTVVSTVDPATGNDLATLDLSCLIDGEVEPFRPITTGRTVHPVEGTDDRVAVADNCAARWGADGAVRWAVPVPGDDLYLDGDPVATFGGLVIGSAHESVALSIDLETGAATRLDTPQDQNSFPLGVFDGVALANTVTNRGTERPGLAAWDVATGEITWTEPPEPGTQPGEGWGYVATLDGDDRMVVTVLADGVPTKVTVTNEDPSVTFEELDPATGQTADPQRYSLPERPEHATSSSVMLESSEAGWIAISVRDHLWVGRGDGAAEPLIWPAGR